MLARRVEAEASGNRAHMSRAICSCAHIKGMPTCVRALQATATVGGWSQQEPATNRSSAQPCRHTHGGMMHARTINQPRYLLLSACTLCTRATLAPTLQWEIEWEIVIDESTESTQANSLTSSWSKQAIREMSLRRLRSEELAISACKAVKQ